MFSSRYTNPYYCRSIICHSPLPCHSPCHSPVKCHNSPLRCLSARKADSPRRDIPVSQNLSLRMSPERRFSPVRCCFVCHATPCLSLLSMQMLHYLSFIPLLLLHKMSRFSMLLYYNNPNNMSFTNLSFSMPFTMQITM